MDARQLKHAASKVNAGLYELGRKYHDFIPVYAIDSLLVENGFDATEPAIYCGRDGRIMEEIGHGKHLLLHWYKMDSGRYEITSYIS